MSAPAQHRYRITVTPIEKDGLPCSGRCSIEFEHRDVANWMHQIESLQRQRGLNGDERTALAVGLRLLASLGEHRQDDEPWRELQAQLHAFSRKLGAT